MSKLLLILIAPVSRHPGQAMADTMLSMALRSNEGLGPVLVVLMGSQAQQAAAMGHLVRNVPDAKLLSIAGAELTSLDEQNATTR